MYCGSDLVQRENLKKKKKTDKDTFINIRLPVGKG